MANKTPLATWLYSKGQELNPRFKEFSWPARVFPGLYDFSTTIAWNGLEARGRGVDLQREIALEKSASEAIERLICITLGFDSVGFALAGTHDPTDHAKFETMERYFLNRHIKNAIAFLEVTVDSEFVSKFKNQNSGAELRFFRMQTPSDIFGLVCNVKTEEPTSTALGFALSKSLDRSVQRSLFEALPNFAWLTDKNGSMKFEMPWHIDPKFLSKIEPLLISGSYSEEISGTVAPQLSQVEVPVSSISVLSSAPIQMARFLISREWK